jgi:hypothetical protein
MCLTLPPAVLHDVAHVAFVPALCTTRTARLWTESMASNATPGTPRETTAGLNGRGHNLMSRKGEHYLLLDDLFCG